MGLSAGNAAPTLDVYSHGPSTPGSASIFSTATDGTAYKMILLLQVRPKPTTNLHCIALLLVAVLEKTTLSEWLTGKKCTRVSNSDASLHEQYGHRSPVRPSESGCSHASFD
eukprot:scaffold517815_cov39-Prasinocladus_malaysianus.AAC.1